MAEGGFNHAMSATESISRADNLYSRHSRNYVENVSMEICTIMTRLGYGEEIRRWRAENYRERDRLYNAQPIDVTTITAGSKTEGLTCYFESDSDYLHVLNPVLCVEAGINIHSIPEDMEVFRMDTCVYPGHCKLFLERLPPGSPNLIINSLCKDGYGGILLSSGLLLDQFATFQLREAQNSFGTIVTQERAGPSIPSKIKGFKLELQGDHVLALRCHCPSILQRWAARHRYWPPPVIFQKVVSFGAYVTPVGFKGSEYKNIEWRICFNTGEAELVNNLYDTQAKVYVLLKMITKHVLRPCKKEIVRVEKYSLWQAESNQQNTFYARSLVHWLHDGLRQLRTAIATQQLSYYMIPDRNLMAATGLQEKQQSQWVADITDMMAEGPRLFLRLPNIRQAIIASPEPMLWFSKTQMKLEMLNQMSYNRMLHCGGYAVYDVIHLEIMRLKLQINKELIRRVRRKALMLIL